jgi:hypothetical protein
MSGNLFEDSCDVGHQVKESEQLLADDDKPARSYSRYSHVIAGLVFCLLYLPFKSHSWSWPVACAVSYTTFVFAIALGLSLDDASDFFGDPRVVKYAATLLLPHALILAPVTFLWYLWLVATPLLPRWVTEVHRVSLWQLCGIVPTWFVGTREGIWMSEKFKRRRQETEN